MDILALLIFLIYVLDTMALFYFGLHCYFMLYLYLKDPKKCRSDYRSAPFSTTGFKDARKRYVPHVTVQLPVYNEYYVIERLIDSVVALRYPKSKLEIQVLDDSTDASKELALKKVAHYKKKGMDIKHLTRKNREGHKAGSLKYGLGMAKGEFIAIFDADFIPNPEFLERTLPFFYQDRSIGMVQARWGHVNEDYSLLTKAQSIGVDGHFMIEQVARNASGLWMNFNGTAGIWRRECILDAGNWQHDTLTEDFDLSYRAELRGWKFKYLSDLLCPAELPSTASAFKSQQFRWCKGSLQTAVKLIPSIIRSKEPLRIKVEAITHLLNYTVHPLIYLNILLTFPLLLIREQFPQASDLYLAILMSVIGFATLGPMTFYAASQISLYKDWGKKLRYLPVLSMIGAGIALNNTKAWLEGVRGKRSSFIRTPKLGIVSNRSNKQDQKRIFRSRKKYSYPRLDMIIILEAITVLYLLWTIFFSIYLETYSPIIYLTIYFLGFFYIVVLSFLDYFRSVFGYRSKELRSAIS